MFSRANKKTWLSSLLMLSLLAIGTAVYLNPSLIMATPLSNASSEPRSLSDLVNFTRISNLRETTLSPLSTDWESALSTLQQYPGTAPVYSEACSRYSCPGGIPISLGNAPQTILPQKGAAIPNGLFGRALAGIGNNVLVGEPQASVSGLTSAGAAFVFDNGGSLLLTLHEPTSAAYDQFGSSVASVGNNIIVGSPLTSVGGFAGAGAAYLFDSHGNLLNTLHEPTPAGSNEFGSSVAGVGGNILVSSLASVGSTVGAGAVYIFDSSGNFLKTLHEPTIGTNDHFGAAISGNGGYVLIGSPGTGPGAVYLFDVTGNLLRTLHEPTVTGNDDFGSSVSIGAEILVGSPLSNVGPTQDGAAYLFDFNGNLLSAFHEPTPFLGDAFGLSVAFVGNNIVIGSPITPTGGLSSAGAAFIFDGSGALIKMLREPTYGAFNEFGYSVASAGGNVVIGSPYSTVAGFANAGAANLFDSSGGFLRTLQQVSRPSNGFFGQSVASAGRGIVVGAPGDNNNAGIVYLLDGNGNVVRTLQKTVPVGFDYFGNSVAAVGSNILVGVPGDGTQAISAGAAYVFNGTGSLLMTLHKPGLAAGDKFGATVASVGSGMVIGVPGNATSGLSGAGAVYLFDNGGNFVRALHEPNPASGDNIGNSLAGVGGNVVIGSPFANVGALTSAGAAYLFDTSGNLLKTFHEPNPASNDFFGWTVTAVGANIAIAAPFSSSVYVFDISGNLVSTLHEPNPGTGDRFGTSIAAVGGSIIVGASFASSGGIASSGAAYLFDFNGNFLKTLSEPLPTANDYFGAFVASAGGSILIGSPSTSVGDSLRNGAVYLYRQFGLRDACAAATGVDCLVVGEAGSFQAGPTLIPMNVVAVSLRSSRNATSGMQMALTIMCNKAVVDAALQCSALFVDGNVWGPARDAVKAFYVVNAEPYFYLQWHWWDPYNQRITSWSYWWYGSNVNPNWYWTVYLGWRTYTATNLGAWSPWWWWWWHWTYYLYWNYWSAGVPFSTG